jgi:serpin B
MGMPLAFDRRQADFTGIANPKDPEDRLYVSSVFHKGFIKVDEKGTEAAAASAVVMARAGGARPVAPPKEFKADHPFLYLLRDTRSGLVLFMGRVADPSAR